MDSEQAIDLERLRSLVESTVEAGVHGLVPCGSTGEFAHLTNGERRAIVEVVIEQVGGRVPVVPHIGALTTVAAIELARHAESAGASGGVMAVAPYYDPLTPGEAKDYFRAVADSVACPVIVYNLRWRPGMNLTPDDLVDTARSADNVEYVKDTSGNYDQVARLLPTTARTSRRSSEGTMLPAAFVEGAAGSIIGATNFLASRLVATTTPSTWIWTAPGTCGTAGIPGSARPARWRLHPQIKGAFEILGAPIGTPRSPVHPSTPRDAPTSVMRCPGLGSQSRKCKKPIREGTSPSSRRRDAGGRWCRAPGAGELNSDRQQTGPECATLD